MTSKQTQPDKRTVRERAAAARAAQQAAERRRDRTLRAVIAIVVVAVVVGIGLGVYLTGRQADTATTDTALPAGVTSPGGGVPYGPATGAPVLDMWEDYQCPGCKALETAMGKRIEQLTDAGKVRVVYHPLSFLDERLGNDASLRAAAVGGCAANAGKYRQYHDVVYANQPAQEGAGYTDEQLLQFGRQAGITGSAYDTFASCVSAKTFLPWAQQVQSSMADNQVSSTPTLVLDGKQLPTKAYTTPDGKQYSGDALAKTIEAAAQG